MHAPAPWKEWTGRVLQLGVPRLALGAAILFILLALVSPIWSFRVDRGAGDSTTSVFGWTAVTTEEFESGNWRRTTIESYAAANEPNIAAATGGAYLSMVVYLIVLVATSVLFSMAWSKTMSPLLHLVLSLFVTIVALWTLFGPILGIQNAAPIDLAAAGVSGFWGTRTATNGTFTWGAGVGWWFILIATILGILGVGLPYVKSVRAMGTARPRNWALRP